MKADDETDGGGALQELAAAGAKRCFHGSALQAARGVMDGGADAVIGAAAADVAVHGEIDVLSVGLGTSLNRPTADMICPDWQ